MRLIVEVRTRYAFVGGYGVVITLSDKSTVSVYFFLGDPPQALFRHSVQNWRNPSQSQAEAIAIGIAYGFLVPKLTKDADGRPMFPASDIVMRLGYPVAVANCLPLRQGEVLKIVTLRQLELSWWNE